MFKYIIVLVVVLSCFSCEDFFETTLKVDPPPHTEQLVIQSFVGDQDSILKVSLTRSFGLLEEIDYSDFIVNDATVELLEGENLIATLESDPNGAAGLEAFNYILPVSSDIFEIGKTYTLKADHPTKGNLTVSQTMPSLVSLDRAIFKENAGIDEFGERTDQAELVFQDPPGVDNYYQVSLIRKSSLSSNLRYVYSFSNDLNVVEVNYGRSFVLSDETFDGKEYKLLLNFTDYNNNEDTEYAVFWESITKDNYLYTRSAEFYTRGDDFEGFSEPVSLHSNVEGGLGIFGMYTRELYDLEQ